ncbi:MAG TPA: response regulator, partial [Telluria sp.]|nr:response regulator [Telluria sp.]
LERFTGGELPPPQPELIEQLQNLRAHLPREAPASPYAQAAPELREHLDALFAATYSDLISNPPPESSMPGLGEVPKVPEAVVQEMDQLFDAAFDDAFDAPVLTQVAPEPLAASPALPVPDAVLTDAPLEHEDAESFTGSSVPAPEDEEHAQAFALGASPADDAEGLLEPPPETGAVPEPLADIDELLLSAESVAAALVPAGEQEAGAFAPGAALAADAGPLLEPLPELTLEPEPAGDELLLPVESLDAVPAPADDAEAEAFALGAAPVSDAEALLERVPEPALEPEPVPAAPLPATGPARDELLLPADSVSAAAAPADEQEAEAFALGASPLADAEALLEPAAQAVEEMPPSMGISVTPDDTATLAAALADDLDPDLLPVFIEEATDLLPQIGAALRSWQQKPGDTAPAHAMQRMLHTVKGSARMAGAMRLGQHTHDIETQVENMVHAGTSTPAAFDELMANFDQAMLMFERLQAGEAAAAPLPAAQPSAAQTSAASQAPAEEQQAVQARTPLVRVRADILDRLVNQAGEVSIARSKLETQIGTVKASLDDFADNLTRLRAQLREIEIQAETQIASRLSIAGEREFDPLEFDRFTRLQELTRMMAESVSDVASFHDGLVRAIDGASGDLAVQSRLTRDLQQDLMRVRMVPFASLSERLFRVARQAAKELDKRVNLDIRGGNVEIDRSVLEQMAAPFEHLLRNAIVHGIEPRARRAAAGKPETGELLVQVSQQGNEVVLAFSDDGGGLDLDRIRAKAEERGLLEQGQVVSDAACADLIFEPGFSTADALTELAGRGVGMDVVRSEAESLGGRVAIDSTRGAGTRFTIHLPLTLAVTQVVLTRSAGTVYALPAILVEQVLQVKEAAMQMALTAGRIEHQGAVLPLHYLPTLLGEREARPLVQRSSPVLVLRNGADRIALLVDLVEGNREVVVKNIGPQLARMAGIAGATVLGSGDIVLILNPVTLAHHLELHPELRAQGGGAGAGAAPVLFERRGVIMVVDDSLTVRKVTQRLLEREGYQVVLAKDGVDALEQVQETRPDLMLVDIEMPRMDGFDLTRNIRGNDSTRDIPIIMITSRTADKHRNYAFDLGVNGYFGKPYQDAVLLEAIAGLLKQPA